LLIINLITQIRKAENAGKVFWYFLAFLILLNVIPNLNYTGPKSNRHHFEFRFDYLLHFLLLFGLAWQYVFWKKSVLYTNRLKLVKAFLFGVTIALLTEYVQKLIPGRSFNRVDLSYNLIGLLFGSLVSLLYFHPNNFISTFVSKCFKKLK
jgi:VanZ family protein